MKLCEMGFERCDEFVSNMKIHPLRLVLCLCLFAGLVSIHLMIRINTEPMSGRRYERGEKIPGWINLAQGNKEGPDARFSKGLDEASNPIAHQPADFPGGAARIAVDVLDSGGAPFGLEDDEKNGIVIVDGEAQGRRPEDPRLKLFRQVVGEQFIPIKPGFEFENNQQKGDNGVDLSGNRGEVKAELEEMEREQRNEVQVPDSKPGHMGHPVRIPSDLSDRVTQAFQEYSYNAIASDVIGFQRELPDYRPEQCQKKIYLADLPSASVVITFHNEALSTLIRTMLSVIDRSPAQHLREIILVDDASTHENLKGRLETVIEQEIKYPGLRLTRLSERLGLIRAKNMGAELAMGKVIVFLESACEVTTGWLEPLLARIQEHRDHVVSPVLNVIDIDSLEFIPNKNYLNTLVGGFNWNLDFIWETDPNYITWDINAEPTRSVHTPTVFGIVAIERRYFMELGMFDAVYGTLGVENLELSFKTWQCGGVLEVLPCSHVGHIFHDPPGDSDMVFDRYRNIKRLVEIWLDEYNSFVYYINPDVRVSSEGEVAEQIKHRNTLGCKSFGWYINNVYPQAPWPRSGREYGVVRHMESNMCLDKQAYRGLEGSGQPVIVYPCHGKSTQLWLYTEDIQEIRHDELCLDRTDGTILLYGCHRLQGNQFWSYNYSAHELKDIGGLCLDLEISDGGTHTLSMKSCHGGAAQKWEMVMKEWPFGQPVSFV